MVVALGYLLTVGAAALLCVALVMWGVSLFGYRRLRDTLLMFFLAPAAAFVLMPLIVAGSIMAGLPDPPAIGFHAMFSFIATLFGAGVLLGIVIRVKLGPMPG